MFRTYSLFRTHFERLAMSPSVFTSYSSWFVERRVWVLILPKWSRVFALQGFPIFFIALTTLGKCIWASMIMLGKAKQRS